MTTNASAGFSPATLADSFEHHADEEGEVLQRYRALAEKLGTSPAGMLIDEILTDEEMHHLLLRTMARWLRDGAPRNRMPADADHAALLNLTHTLHIHERQTIDLCHKLKAQLGSSENALIVALLDAMALDSEKHDRLLTAVDQLLQEDGRSPQ